MYTREEFEELRGKWAEAMAADADLGAHALDVLVRADRYNWIHQTSWFGEPVLQLPQDMFAIQEILFRTRPEYIVEVGVAWAGSLLFYATLMEVLGGKGVIGVDTYVPDDLRERVGAFTHLSDRIHLVCGSSTDPDTVREVESIVAGSTRVMVNLDSSHTHAHVLEELRLYSRFVGKGQYLVCCDTIIDDIPAQTHRPRPWGPGNSPRTALDEFMIESDRFRVDYSVDRKLLFTCNPGGYTVCVRD